MVSKFGEFLFSQKFKDLAQDSIDEAIAEANARGLPKAYSEWQPKLPANESDPIPTRSE